MWYYCSYIDERYTTYESVMSLTIQSYTFLYLFIIIINEFSDQAKMLMFYNVQITNVTFCWQNNEMYIKQ
jgi:hypothetical protein